MLWQNQKVTRIEAKSSLVLAENLGLSEAATHNREITSTTYDSHSLY